MTEVDPRTIRVSWSQIRAAEECRQKAFLLRTGHRSPAGDLRNFFPGMVVDLVMNRWLADPGVPGGMVTLVAAVLEETLSAAVADGDGVVKWRHPGDQAEVVEFCTELVRRLEPILARLILPHPFAAHTRFTVPVAVPYLTGEPVAVNLNGEMDLLSRPPAGNVIYDLKGTRDNSYWRKVVGQLLFYDLADFLATGTRPVRSALIQPMCTEAVLPFTFSDDDRRGMQARIIAYATDVWRKEHDTKAGTHGCTFCNVRHACARHAPHPGNTVFLGTLSAGLREHAQKGTP